MKHYTLTSPRTSHYFVLGNIKKAKNIWIVLHGLGQLGDEFIKPFEILEGDHAIVSVEAPSRYYLDDRYEKIGASWMTKRFKDEEIKDQMAMLNNLHSAIIEPHHIVHVLGFSQGVAAVMRWATYEKPRINSMILWAGWPPEMEFEAEEIKYFSEIKNVYVYGKADKFISEQRIKKFEERADMNLLNLEHIVFDGGHRLSRKVITQVASLVSEPS